jgi:hypothetical protein
LRDFQQALLLHIAMVLDPLSAFSVAGSVVQFVDYGTKLTSYIVELYNSTSGIAVDNAEILSLTHHFKQLAEGLSNIAPKGEGEANVVVDRASFQSLLLLCKSTATELIAVLDDLKVDKSNKLWSSIRQGFRSSRKKDDIVKLVNRIESLRGPLNSYLLALLQ